MPKTTAVRRFFLKVLDATRELMSGSSIDATGTHAHPLSFDKVQECSAPPVVLQREREILPVNSEGTLCTRCHKEVTGEHGSTFFSRVPVKIKPGQRMLVVARPQRFAFKPEHILIENGERWTVHDIKIGNRSQFAQSGDISGAIFTPGASPAIGFETALTAMDVAFDVTYQGPEQNGEQFRASVVGMAAN